MVHNPSIFPSGCSANTMLKRETERIYFQDTTVKLIFVLYFAKLCFYQVLTNFIAKINIVSAEENTRGLVTVFMMFCFVYKLLLSF